MKILKKYLLPILIILLFISCADNPVNENITDIIEGTWVNRSYKEDVFTMEKSFNLENDNSGFVILDNGTFIERKNVGWCGAPLVVYNNYNGSWESKSEEELIIAVGYWGDTENYLMKIISLNNSFLKFKKIVIQ